MRVFIHTPSPPLHRFIHSMIYYRGYEAQYNFVRFLPDGTSSLIIALDELRKTFYSGADAFIPISCHRAWLQGPQDHFYHSTGDMESIVFIIQFHPNGSYPFLQLPLQGLSNLAVDAELVLGPSVQTLREQLQELVRPQDMFRLAEAFLWQHYEEDHQEHAVVAFALNQLSQSGSLSMKQLVEKTGYSHKHFIHLFKKNVGMPPKHYQRIARFNRVLEQVATDPWPSTVNWLDLTHAGGFYDQAHFINEFKAFTGMSPNDYFQHPLEYSHLLPWSLDSRQ